ncbi:MAG: hypothetical protein IKE94_04615 [Aeriscardovia sp.]|nr:hypothetical protein [Aeriscardovia sp.]
MAKAKNLANVAKITNAQFLKAVSDLAPEFSKVTAKVGQDVFTEKGFQALNTIEGGATRFYALATVVGAQFVDIVNASNPLDGSGLMEVYEMGSGAYLQRNAVKRIRNVNPAWLGADGTGLKNGDSPDPFTVRKPEVEQRYFTLNRNYQNWFSLQEFDLKQGWLTEDGIGSIVSAIYAMVRLDYTEWEFAAFFEVLSGAINSTEHELKDSQSIALSSWTEGRVTDAELTEMIRVCKNVGESMEIAPTSEALNSASYPNPAKASDHVMLVRAGFRSRFEELLGFVFNEARLQFPFEIKSVPNFGGISYVYRQEGEDDVALYPQYDSLGVFSKFNTKEDGTGTDYTEAQATAVDNNADVLAIIIQKGAIFELTQNELMVEPIRNPRGVYTNVWWNRPDNGFNFDYYRNIVVIRKPDATP